MIKKMIRLNREDFLQSFYLLGGAFTLLELVIAKEKTGNPLKNIAKSFLMLYNRME